MKYECYKCNWSTHIKTKIVSHLARTRPCKNINNFNLDNNAKLKILEGFSFEEYKKTIKSATESATESANITTKTLKCIYCNNIYVHKQSLFKHYKTCKEKKTEDDVKDSMNKLVNLLNEQLNEKNEQLNDFKKELTKRDNNFKKELIKRDNELIKRDLQIDELIKKAGIINNISTTNVLNNIKLLSYSKTDRSHLTDKDIIKCLKHSNFCIPHLIEKIHFDKNKPENHNVYISNLPPGLSGQAQPLEE